MSNELANALREDLFPGNTDAFEQLRSFVDKGNLTIFSGAGVSAPLFPTWSAFLVNQLDRLIAEGLIPKGEAGDYRSLIDKDPLDLAASLQLAATTGVFRARIGDFFRNSGNCTSCQDAISALAVRSIVTLNYDLGHEVAYGKTGRYPTSERAQDHGILDKWSQNDITARSVLPILHFHGDTGNPASMILTADDYDKFYGQPSVQDFIPHLWKTHNLLVVGFGFSDPFLTRIVENSLRSLEAENRHFAFIGRPENASLSAMHRQIYSRKYKLRPVFYEIKGEHGSDHSSLLALLRGLTPNSQNPDFDLTTHVPSSASPPPAPAKPTAVSVLEQQFRADLHVAPNHSTLYVEPRFTAERETLDDDEDAQSECSLDYLVSSENSIMLLCKPEYGATTVARRLTVEFARAGKTAIICDAEKLPNYKRKLEAYFSDQNVIAGQKDQVLILDNFDPVGNERLLKEIIGTKLFERLIVLVLESMFEGPSAMSAEQLPIKIEWLRLSALSRADVRTLTIQFYDSSDSDTISAIVEKVYNDLITLCIPITPSNIIMYLTVLLKDGDFQPLNRVQIVHRYLSALLARPSDAMEASFTAKNKMDVISAFVFDLDKRGQRTFSTTDWQIFCRRYMAETLTSFDERRLLTTLISTRVLVPLGDLIFFKYRFFHTFFLGRQVAHKPLLLAAFMEDNSYLRHSGLVEVMADLTPDNEPLFNDIVGKLEAVLTEFDQRYIPHRFDPFSELEWPVTADESERLWKPLNEKLAKGPRNVAEIDAIKRSLTQENQASDQNLIVQDFDRLERRLVLLEQALANAIHNSDSLPASTKKRAVLALMKSYLVFFQVGMVLSPSIAKSAYFRWHGLAFINFDQATDETDETRRQFGVVMAIQSAVLGKVADEIGSRKIGEVFKAFASDPDVKGFLRVINFATLIRSKPRNWKKYANDIIAAISRNEYYLYEVMKITNKQFHVEVNTNAEREDLKQIIAMIQLKRQGKNSNAGEKDLRKVVQKLDKLNAFDS